jgi:hypothetical protein
VLLICAYFEANQIPRRFSDNKNGWDELGKKLVEDEE